MHLSLPALLPLHLYVALRFLLGPWFGVRQVRALRKASAAAATGDAAARNAKLDYYKRFCLGNLLHGTACWALLALLPRLSLSPGMVFGLPEKEIFFAFGVAGALGGILGEGIELLLLRKKTRRSTLRRRDQYAARMHALPWSHLERRWFIGVSCMAGYGEEITYRAFLIAYLLLFLHLSVGWALIASSVIFGLAHLGQGWKSVVLTSVIGCIFGMSYLATGYLWFPMLLHALFNLRILPEMRMVGLMEGREPIPDPPGPTPAPAAPQAPA